MIEPWNTDPYLDQYRVDDRSVVVVRDDLLAGGSKARFLPELIKGAKEVVYGAPFCGGAPVALATIGKILGIRVTIFYAARLEANLHPRQILAREQGARLCFVPHGYMSHVQKTAKEYATTAGALFLPLGFDVPEATGVFIAAMETVRRRIGDPEQVWCASGSGMLARCLGLAFPASQVQAVAVGLASRWQKQNFSSNVVITQAPEPYAKALSIDVPFPCCPNYERKAWRIYRRLGKDNSLFWNVMGD